MKMPQIRWAGVALAVLLALGLIAACDDPATQEPDATPPGQAPMMQPPENDAPPRAHEQPGQTPPGQAPMAEPVGPPAEDTDQERP